MSVPADEDPLYTLASDDDGERTPLLSSDTSSTISTPSNHGGIIVKDGADLEGNKLPENSTLGRNIGWSSAYILVMSRVIGSGIFAMRTSSLG